MGEYVKSTVCTHVTRTSFRLLSDAENTFSIGASQVCLGVTSNVTLTSMVIPSRFGGQDRKVKLPAKATFVDTSSNRVQSVFEVKKTFF